jgi:cation diffusion facilitator CzcD-associated flavoprotein CzcO
VRTQVLIVGGGTSGVASALALAEMGIECVIVEETDWVGGQLTAQAVPSDEHIWIEQFGCTRRYREFRNRLRDYYRKHYTLTPESLADPFLNPGAGYVSPICAEPRVIHDVLNSFLAPFRANEKLKILLRHEFISANATDGHVNSVTCYRSHVIY